MEKALKLGAGIAVLAVLGVWLYTKAKGGLQDATATAISGAASAAGKVASGAVLGIGDAFGLPRTNTEQCAWDKANGDWWAASFSCPASDLFSGAGIPQTTGGYRTEGRNYPQPKIADTMDAYGQTQDYYAP